jgi:hypothetical protein
MAGGCDLHNVFDAAGAETGIIQARFDRDDGAATQNVVVA